MAGKCNRLRRLLSALMLAGLLGTGGLLTGCEGGEAQEEDAVQENETVMETILEEADRLAAGYDYDAALAQVRAAMEQSDDARLKEAESRYLKEQAALVAWPDPTQVTHIFFHSLLVEPARAFDGDYKQDDYNQTMTTVQEYRAILQQMYERGYVLVSLRDIARMETGVDGVERMTPQTILLPEGKKPFILSQDDVSYYSYMKGDGFASRLVVGEDGLVTCEMEQDGKTVTGSFDLVPVTEDFIREHPDFSYRGARGILALTGYNGVLGYRTCPSDEATVDLEGDIEKAKTVAQALRAQGWEFASHSWGHRDMAQQEFGKFCAAADRWQAEVAPILGEVDIMIYPFGTDVAEWNEPYEGNQRYVYLKAQGFDYFCYVDAVHPYSTYISDAYVRQGRRNVDGYRMYQDLTRGKNRLSDLFDVKSVFDPARPLPVPDMA